MTDSSRPGIAGARSQMLAVAAGLAVYGLATYGYLGAAGRGLTAEDFAPLSVMWTLLNALGIGLFLPFEQEIARRTAVARATGTANAPEVRRALLGAGGLLAGVAVIAAAAGRPLAQNLFAGSSALVALMVASMAGMAASYVARGLLSGNGRFGRYGAQLAVDGLLRVAGAATLAVAGNERPAAYGAVLVLSPLLAVGLTTPRVRLLLTSGPRPARVGAAASLAALIVASVLSQALANAGTVIVQLLAGHDEAAAAGHFTAALVVARIPLFAFAAVQAVLLPGLAGLVGAGDAAGLRARSVTVLTWTAGLGVLG
ncbi:MAG TPA: polysaccharide biosynthesis protein, partial [Rugosimonospora sp.]|nr:polysaccharide biosynthesis protein [Rugosimonospora sp.]